MNKSAFVYPGTRKRLFGELAKPLKIGIYDDLLARYPGADAEALQAWVRHWTTLWPYHRAIENGSVRYDLDGNEAGAITDDQRVNALRVAAEVKAKHQRKRERAKRHRQLMATQKAGKSAGQPSQKMR